MATRAAANPFTAALKSRKHRFNIEETVALFTRVSEERVALLAHALAYYIIRKKKNKKQI
jgi:hypothetical protein